MKTKKNVDKVENFLRSMKSFVFKFENANLLKLSNFENLTCEKGQKHLCIQCIKNLGFSLDVNVLKFDYFNLVAYPNLRIKLIFESRKFSASLTCLFCIHLRFVQNVRWKLLVFYVLRIFDSFWIYVLLTKRPCLITQ